LLVSSGDAVSVAGGSISLSSGVSMSTKDLLTSSRTLVSDGILPIPKEPLEALRPQHAASNVILSYSF
jgi:hypothetical protein